MQSMMELSVWLAGAGVVGVVLGWLVAVVIHARRLAQHQAQWHQEQYERELLQSKSEVALQHAQATEQRLSAELQAERHELVVAAERLELLRQQQYEIEKNYAAEQSLVQAQQQQLHELRQRLAQAEQKVEQWQAQHRQLEQAHTQLAAEYQERQASHAREVASFAQQKASLSEQFKVLATDILEQKSRSLQESSSATLTALMNPFQQSIDSFKQEVRDIHHRETSQQGELRKELANLKELNQRITTEAHELSTALRGQKKLQGNWGELVLENILDRSGLQAGRDYQREVSITTEQGRQRPDAIVYLPQDKHLIIDAKVSLNAYTRYVNAEDELTRSHALKQHVQAVSARIKELADRDYYRLPGLNSPEIVFMFIPIESAFVEALKADEGLFQQAIESNVLVATPTTLLTSLNIVRQLWRYEDQNKHTAALAQKAESVFNKLNGFLDSFGRIKKSLDAASEAYGKAENQLVSGRGNLVKQVGDFKSLAPAIKAELPEYFVEKSSLEIDFVRNTDGPDSLQQA